MSKVEAYKCNYCAKIYPAEEVVGIIDIADLFSSLESYPTTNDPAKARVHHCTDCSHTHVIIKTEELSPRNKDERAYQIRFKELYAIFKGVCVFNAQNKKKVVHKFGRSE